MYDTSTVLVQHGILNHSRFLTLSDVSYCTGTLSRASARKEGLKNIYYGNKLFISELPPYSTVFLARDKLIDYQKLGLYRYINSA